MKALAGTTVAIVLFLFLGVGPAHAEDVPIVEYRFARDLGLVQVTTGYVDRSPDLASRQHALEKNGVVVLETEVNRTFSRKDRVGVHVIETTLSISPPVGHGEGGASSQVRIKVVLDGAPRVDCSLWSLDRISVDPRRKFVTLLGHEGIVRFDGFESAKIIDDDWLADRAESMRKLIVRGATPSR